MGLYSEDDNPLYKVNDVAPIIRTNLEMVNGYIHVISKVLRQPELSGYEWLLQQGDFSILAQALELSGLSELMQGGSYTILAEQDTVYHRNGIHNIDDLIERMATPGIPFSDRENHFYQFTAYHILNNEFYLNDFYLGREEYRTLADERLTIDVGLEMKINPGAGSFGTSISEDGDTIVIDYIRPVWEACNIRTLTGPVHSITDLLTDEPLPGED